MADGFEISRAAADLLGEQCGVDLHIQPFDLPYVGYTDAERRWLAQGMLRDLDARGLAHRGRLEPDVEDALVLLGRAPTSATLIVATRSGKRQAAARIASDGRHAVLATVHGETLRFEPVRPSGVITALLALVPNIRPIAGRAVTFPLDDDAPVKDGQLAGDIMMSAIRPAKTGYDRERHRAHLMTQRLRGRAGTAFIYRRDRHGREQQAPLLIWHDTDAGRYMVYNTTGSDGRTWVSYAPADNARLGQQLGQLWSAHTATS